MKRRGFTLIELLAVIVILAIIALIAVPIILNIIEDSKRNAVIRSGELYLDAVEQAIVMKNLKEEFAPEKCEIQRDGNLICDGESVTVKVDGEKPTDGIITFEKGIIKKVDGMKLGGFELETGKKDKLVIKGTATDKDPEVSTSYLKSKSIYYDLFTDIFQVKFTMSTDDFNNYIKEKYGEEIFEEMQQEEFESKVRQEYMKALQHFLDTPIEKAKIEKIVIKNTKDVPKTAIASFDVSEVQDKSIMAWYTDEDNNNLYELYIGGEGGVKANPDSSMLFDSFLFLTEIDLTYLDTSQVINMTGMLSNLRLTNLDLSSFDTSKVTDMGYMFLGSNKLTSIKFGENFNTSQVINMTGMFVNCSMLESLDLSSFDTSKVTNMNSLFKGCYGLKEIDFRNADFTNVAEYGNMFTGNYDLQKIWVKDETAQTFIKDRLVGEIEDNEIVDIA